MDVANDLKKSNKCSPRASTNGTPAVRKSRRSQSSSERTYTMFPDNFFDDSSSCSNSFMKDDDYNNRNAHDDGNDDDDDETTVVLDTSMSSPDSTILKDLKATQLDYDDQPQLSNSLSYQQTQNEQQNQKNQMMFESKNQSNVEYTTDRQLSPSITKIRTNDDIKNAIIIHDTPPPIEINRPKKKRQIHPSSISNYDNKSNEVCDRKEVDVGKKRKIHHEHNHVESTENLTVLAAVATSNSHTFQENKYGTSVLINDKIDKTNLKNINTSDDSKQELFPPTSSVIESSYENSTNDNNNNKKKKKKIAKVSLSPSLIHQTQNKLVHDCGIIPIDLTYEECNNTELISNNKETTENKPKSKSKEERISKERKSKNIEQTISVKQTKDGNQSIPISSNASESIAPASKARKNQKSDESVRVVWSESDDVKMNVTLTKKIAEATAPEESIKHDKSTCPSTMNPSTNDQKKTNAKKQTQSNEKPNDVVVVNKTKKKKMTLQDQILNHLLISFKPFTIRSLSDVLKTSETTLEYAMLSLIDKDLVMKKEFGNSKGGTNSRMKCLYWADHDVKSKDVNIKMVTESDMLLTKHELQSTRHNVNDLNNKLQHILDQPSNVDLTNQLQQEENSLLELKNQLRDMNHRIDQYNQNSKNAVVATTNRNNSTSNKNIHPDLLKYKINHMRNEWKNRKEKCNDFLEQMMDCMEKKRKDLINLLDIDTDEMNQVQLPPLHPVDNKSASLSTSRNKYKKTY